MTYIKDIEDRAHQSLKDGEFEKASDLFDEAGLSYQKDEQYQQATICFASSASCWLLKFSNERFSHAAGIYEKAAKAARKSNDFEYAAVLYKQAAICYEKDMEYLGFSENFFKSKESYRKFLFRDLFHSSKEKNIQGNKKKKGFRLRLQKALSWFTLSLSSLIWGHGERPQRTVFFGVLTVFICAAVYTQGRLLMGGVVIKPGLFEALYFSVITFTTVGYGDIVPVGLNRMVVVFESFGGLFIIPIFITGLCRKYLKL